MTLVKRAVMMVRIREQMEKACDARNIELRKDTVAKPAAMGCRTRTTRSAV